MARQTPDRPRRNPQAVKRRPPTDARRQPARRPPARNAGPRRPSRQGAGRFSRFARVAGITFALLFVAVAVTGCAVYATISASLPDPDLTKARGRDQSTVITDRHDKTLVKLYAEENRQDVTLSEIPVQLRQAVIATEDRRFYAHEGVDPIGIARALVTDIIKGRKAQGGSTITQQYVKQAFVTSEKTLKRKVQEAILAQKVERRYTKDEILGLYLNTIYFGHGSYGVEAASRAYFGKSVRDLDLAQSAMIAGVIKSPGLYSPYLHPDAAKLRRDTVLGLMRDQGYITAEEHAQAVAQPIELEGLKRRAAKAPYFIEWVKEQLVSKYGERMVYRGGLRVKTTLDLAAQKDAEKAVSRTLDRKGDPSAAVVALEPKTGAVVAMVGGRDFEKQQFNVAVQGKRQPGSAFKPFVLVTALSQGISPERAYKAGPMTLSVPTGKWKVTGASGLGKNGVMRLRKATEKSVNAVFAQLILEVGPEKVVETAEKMGISKGITPVPAIALGGLEDGVSPLDMASAYGTLANAGRHAKPYAIQKVTGSDGKVLFEANPEVDPGIDPALAYLTTDILKGVIARGTGTGASIGRPAAGKTGTTQRYRDAWFVGYTPELACAVWVGYASAQKEMASVHGRAVTGGSFPATIWARFMRPALAGTPASDFQRPTGLVTRQVCSVSGEKPRPFCPSTVRALMLPTTQLVDCPIHLTATSIEVPDVVGMTKADALSALEAAGLQVTLEERPVAGVGVGVVAEQTPEAGSTVEPDSTVTIVVATDGSANMPPTAQFSGPATVRPGKPATFDASPSADDGTIVTYYWEFGDGATASGKTTSHTWQAPGTYEITLWVTDDSGEQASVTKAITVR
jgi:penicillin-binding protein 1A